MKISTAKTPAKAPAKKPAKTTPAKATRAAAAKSAPVKTKREATADNAPSLKGTRTEANLKAAFAGESEARNKYTYFAGKAKKEGLNQIADFFIETAENEKEHAKIWFKLLYGEISDTAANLKSAAAGENFEWTNMYAKMAQEAREEGFDKIADLFDAVGKIEKEHEARYLALLKNIEEGQVFVKPKKVAWQCANCGHTYKDTNAPDICPVCNHPQAYFEVLAQNY